MNNLYTPSHIQHHDRIRYLHSNISTLLLWAPINSIGIAFPHKHVCSNHINDAVNHPELIYDAKKMGKKLRNNVKIENGKKLKNNGDRSCHWQY